MEQNKQFRTAGFGGFHRQDVLDYIERTAKEQADRRRELTDQLQEARAQIQAREEESSALREQLRAAQLELEQVKADRNLLAEDTARMSGQLDQLLTDGRSVGQLKEELEECRRQAAGYLRLKTNYAEIELDARQRAIEQLAQAKVQAQVIADQAQAQYDQRLRQAGEQAEKILAEAKTRAATITAQAQCQAEKALSKAQNESLHLREARRQLLSRIRRDFHTSSADLSASITAALREVEGLRQSLLDLNTTFEENAHAVDELCDQEG